MTLEQFTEALAAATPTPGGGSASAQAGAMAAALVQMTCDLTLGREPYRAHDEAVRAIRARSEGLRRDLLTLVDRDAQAYDEVVRALRLPKVTDVEKQVRSEALARANLFAIETPLATADACAALMEMAAELASKGNVNVVSDVGTAALLAYAGLRGGDSHDPRQPQGDYGRSPRRAAARARAAPRGRFGEAPRGGPDGGLRPHQRSLSRRPTHHPVSLLLPPGRIGSMTCLLVILDTRIDRSGSCRIAVSAFLIVKPVLIAQKSS